MEDPRRRAADEKVLRIDHSDVYLENDRLSEELGKSLDTIFRAKHRTVINHVYEMRQLRRSLNVAASRNPRTISSVAALRPHTSPMYSRTRAPRVVKLDVHVPSAHAHADSLVGGGGHPHSRPNIHERNSSSRSSNNVSDDDDNDEDEDEESEESSDDVADEKAAGRVSRGVLSGHVAGRNGLATKDQTVETPVPRKVSKQKKLLERLNLTKVPESWFTDVLPASGPTSATRRIASALPYMTTGNNRVSGSNGRRRHNRSGNPRSRRAKSAMHSVKKEGLSAEESTLVCGGDPEGDCRGTGLRSRRQLMELSGLAASEDETDADFGQRRTELLEAVRLERQRLDARVKHFLKSCDLVHVGGVSSRKERQYSKMFLREVLNT